MHIAEEMDNLEVYVVTGTHAYAAIGRLQREKRDQFGTNQNNDGFDCDY